MANRTQLRLDHVELGPSQVWGTVRLVPLLREEPVPGLRLHPQCIGDEVIVNLGGREKRPRAVYEAYVPHAFIARLEGEDGASQGVAYGSKLLASDQKLKGRGWTKVVHRMAKKRGNALRFLPLHLSIEGYLALQFGGPPAFLESFSEHAVRRGLSPRIEWLLRGQLVPHLDEALRVFEIHPNQAGVLLFVGDTMQAAFLLPCAEDYRRLHRSLLQDVYADTLLSHALGYPEVPEWGVDTRGVRVDSLADLRAFLERTRAEWGEFQRFMADRALPDEPTLERVQTLGTFSLERFVPSFDPAEENHLGEAIVDREGRAAYLKTFRLSALQAKRGYLLMQLGRHNWDICRAADAAGSTRQDFVRRLDNAGFAYLLHDRLLRGV